MSRSALSALVVVAIASRLALAQPDPADPTPLTAKTYTYSDIPYQVDPVTSAIRGPQTGYNQCNTTTESQNSECQTLIVNNVGDFCLFAPPNPNSTIGDSEADEVAWCALDHGARLFPKGTLQGVQVLITSEYVQYAGFLNQVLVDMAADDYGGELDPHGADLRGNPLGALVYSNFWANNNSTEQQIYDWNQFIGGGTFCLTICNPTSSSTDQTSYCQNIYDRMGCTYNMPNNAQNGTFEVCDADLKTPVGIYTSGGATLTYTQPNSGNVDPPYTPVVPSSSNCVTFQSTALYTDFPSTSATAAPSSGASSGSSSPGAPSPTSNGASALGVSAVAGILGTLFAITFLS